MFAARIRLVDADADEIAMRGFTRQPTFRGALGGKATVRQRDFIDQSVFFGT
jgi:hypothetical protein